MFGWILSIAFTLTTTIFIYGATKILKRIENLEASAIDMIDFEKHQRSLNQDTAKNIVEFHKTLFNMEHSVKELEQELKEFDEAWDKDRNEEYGNASQILQLRDDLDVLRDRVKVLQEALVTKTVAEFNESYTDPSIEQDPLYQEYLRKLEEIQ